MTSESFLDRMRTRGLRVTPQRRAVFAALEGHGSIHLTADEIWSRARSVVPEVSRATVYNTLNELVERGELQALTFDGGPVLFDPNASHPHHHFVCRDCGRIDDVEPEGLEQVRLASGHRTERLELVFRGQCPECAATSTA